MGEVNRPKKTTIDFFLSKTLVRGSSIHYNVVLLQRGGRGPTITDWCRDDHFTLLLSTLHNDNPHLIKLPKKFFHTRHGSCLSRSLKRMDTDCMMSLMKKTPVIPSEASQRGYQHIIRRNHDSKYSMLSKLLKISCTENVEGLLRLLKTSHQKHDN
ncbi:hypothetical protein GQR58_014324 [Nymphon striatum]|nr:hypothetical protein GQR58_014324 [Nymphon striatum]